MDPFQQTNIHISGEVERLIEERLILREDLQKVIHNAEISGKKLTHPASSRSLAYYRPKAVFYWVEYSQIYDGYQVHTAYSHRMVMKSSGSTKEWVKSGGNSEWLCNLCQVPLEVQTVRLQYMQSIFPIDLPACSLCGFILIDEKLATGKLAEAEQALEDK
ncbi:MAG: DVU_1557 family redox protein [Desulfuromonadaceae bacterium]